MIQLMLSRFTVIKLSMFAVQSELHLGGCIDRQAPTGDDAIGGSLIDKDVRVSTVSPLLQTSTVQPCDTLARNVLNYSSLPSHVVVCALDMLIPNRTLVEMRPSEH